MAYSYLDIICLYSISNYFITNTNINKTKRHTIPTVFIDRQMILLLFVLSVRQNGYRKYGTITENKLSHNHWITHLKNDINGSKSLAYKKRNTFCSRLLLPEQDCKEMEFQRTTKHHIAHLMESWQSFSQVHCLCSVSTLQTDAYSFECGAENRSKNTGVEIRLRHTRNIFFFSCCTWNIDDSHVKNYETPLNIWFFISSQIPSML